jgi:hypothetical protein
VDQVRHGRETAALARRVLCRTLTVIGGAAAGTAIAWSLSTCAASAETPVDLLGDPAPVLSDAVTPLGGTLDSLARRLVEPPSISLGDVGDQLGNQLGNQLGDQLTETVERVDVLPDDGLPGVVEVVQDTVGAVESVENVEIPVEVTGHGHTLPDTSFVPAPVAAGKPAGKVTGALASSDPEHTDAWTATERAYATGMPHRGSPEPVSPDTPTWPTPFSPNVPVAPGHTGHTGANPADSSQSATFPWLDRAPRPGRGVTAPGAEATFSGRAGDQPGIAPD